jgi:hypothetical protein
MFSGVRFAKNARHTKIAPPASATRMMSTAKFRENRRSVIRGCAEDLHCAHWLPSVRTPGGVNLNSTKCRKNSEDQFRKFSDGGLGVSRIVRSTTPIYVFVNPQKVVEE